MRYIFEKIMVCTVLRSNTQIFVVQYSHSNTGSSSSFFRQFFHRFLFLDHFHQKKIGTMGDNDKLCITAGSLSTLADLALRKISGFLS